MLKQITLLSFISLLLFSCTVTQEPEFIGVENIQILSIKNGNFKIGGNVMFLNPNDVGCTVLKTDIKAFVNGIKIGKVAQKKMLSLEANKKFKLPILFSFTPQDIIKDKKGIFDGVLNTLLNQSVDILLKGIVTLSKLGIPFDIDVESEEKIKINLGLNK